MGVRLEKSERCKDDQCLGHGHLFAKKQLDHRLAQPNLSQYNRACAPYSLP